jgi:general secretion pathway protein J
VNRTKPRRGFTLIELLVVLFITVLLVGSAATFMRMVAAAREVVDKRLSGQQEAMVALRTITSALRNGYRPISDDDAYFEGITEASDPVPICRVRFRAVDRRIIRRGQPESDVHDIEFFIRDDGQHAMLMRRSDPTRNPPPDRGGVIEPLAQDVVGLDLQYLDGQKWVDHWPESMKSWPTAVSVRLVYRADSASGSLADVSQLVNFPHESIRSAGPALQEAVER